MLRAEIVRAAEALNLPAGEESDGAFLGRYVADRDEAAFAAVVRRHGPLVYGVCRRILGQRADADDAFQAVFLVLARRAAALDLDRDVAPWLHAVSVRIARKSRAQAARRRARETAAARPEAVPAPDPPDDFWATFDEELARLAEPLRSVVVVCDLGGLSHAQAGRALGLTKGAVTKRLLKARDALARRLARRGVVPAVGVVALSSGLAVAVPRELSSLATRQAVAFAGGAAVGSVPIQTLAESVMHGARASVAKVVAAAAVLGVLTGGGLTVARVADRPVNETPAPQAAAEKPVDRDAWAKKLAALTDEDWRTAFAVGCELANLPPDTGFDILKANWAAITDKGVRQQLLKAWYFALPYPLHARNHPHILAVLDMAKRDPSGDVRSWADEYLRQLALRDFEADPDSYAKWYAANKDRKPVDVTADGVRAVVAKVAANDAGALDFLARNGTTFRDVPEARRAAKDAGLLKHLERLPTAPDDTALTLSSLVLLENLDAGEAFLRRVVLPLTADRTPANIRAAAIRCLANKSNAWAVDELVRVLVATLACEDADDRERVMAAAADALGSIGDPKAIPALIGVLCADGGDAARANINAHGLTPLTGQKLDTTRTGEWWRTWWAANKARYPEAVQRVAIPNLTAAEAKQPDPLADVADMPAEDRTIGGDAKQRYFFVGPLKGAKQPAAGFGLVVILPGGDGSADFNPFVRRMAKNAFGGSWVVAQPVAPKWDDKQFNTLVWPTEANRYPAAKFTTEEFVTAVVKDVQAKTKIDPKRVVVLGWSSGGPPSYALLARKDSPFTGAFVAMSVFRAEQLPKLDGVKGKSVFLLQSPDDRVTPIRFAEAAEKTLTAAGMRVRLSRYDGGHGWRGDIWENLRTGLTWLDEPAAKK